MHRIKNVNYVFTGMFLILVALLAVYLSWRLSTFTGIGLGPGFVPRMFATAQVVFGAILIVSGFVTNSENEEKESWHLRPLIVLAAIAYFGVTIERMGLVIALIGLVLISCAANRGTRLSESLILAFGAVVFSVLLFVKALGLTIPIWPAGI
jgi:putative tricarboxylic transport membrane protein